jgi:hypothetical protein
MTSGHRLRRDAAAAVLAALAVTPGAFGAGPARAQQAQPGATAQTAASNGIPTNAAGAPTAADYGSVQDTCKNRSQGRGQRQVDEFGDLTATLRLVLPTNIPY